MLTAAKKQSGIGLIELMIASSLGVILLGGAIAMFSSTVATNARTMHITRLNQDMQAIMDVVSDEIKRAGFIDTVGKEYSSEVLLVESYNGSNRCVRYAYDTNNSNSLSSSDFRGFRYNSSLRTLQFMQTNATACSGNDGSWVDINNTREIEITSVTFTRTKTCFNLTDNTSTLSNTNACASSQSGDYATEHYTVDVNITGRLKSDTNIQKTLTNTIKIRSGRIWQI